MKKLFLLSALCSLLAPIAFAVPGDAPSLNLYPATPYLGDDIYSVHTNLFSATNDVSARFAIGAIGWPELVAAKAIVQPASATLTNIDASLLNLTNNITTSSNAAVIAAAARATASVNALATNGALSAPTIVGYFIIAATNAGPNLGTNRVDTNNAAWCTVSNSANGDVYKLKLYR
jgi:hypothetical protein